MYMKGGYGYKIILYLALAIGIITLLSLATTHLLSKKKKKETVKLETSSPQKLCMDSNIKNKDDNKFLLINSIEKKEEEKATIQDIDKMKKNSIESSMQINQKIEKNDISSNLQEKENSYVEQQEQEKSQAETESISHILDIDNLLKIKNTYILAYPWASLIKNKSLDSSNYNNINLNIKEMKDIMLYLLRHSMSYIDLLKVNKNSKYIDNLNSMDTASKLKYEINEYFASEEFKSQSIDTQNIIMSIYKYICFVSNILNNTSKIIMYEVDVINNFIKNNIKPIKYLNKKDLLNKQIMLKYMTNLVSNNNWQKKESTENKVDMSMLFCQEYNEMTNNLEKKIVSDFKDLMKFEENMMMNIINKNGSDFLKRKKEKETTSLIFEITEYSASKYLFFNELSTIDSIIKNIPTDKIKSTEKISVKYNLDLLSSSQPNINIDNCFTNEGKIKEEYFQSLNTKYNKWHVFEDLNTINNRCFEQNYKILSQEKLLFFVFSFFQRIENYMAFLDTNCKISKNSKTTDCIFHIRTMMCILSSASLNQYNFLSFQRSKSNPIFYLVYAYILQNQRVDQQNKNQQNDNYLVENHVKTQAFLIDVIDNFFHNDLYKLPQSIKLLKTKIDDLLTGSPKNRVSLKEEKSFISRFDITQKDYGVAFKNYQMTNLICMIWNSTNSNN